MKFYFFVLLMVVPVFQASANPLHYLKREIKKSGYILFRTPLASAGTGTLVGGTPKAMSIVADPQTCFPYVVDGQPSLIRKVEETNLGSISQTTSFDGKVAVDLLKFMNTGNSIFTVGAGVNVVQSVVLEFEGAKIEYIDTILLLDFYQHHLSDSCKKILDSVGFIIQALRVDKMRYSFKDKSGAYLKLDMEGISKILNINADIKYHIEKDYTLVIDTPKYIGYQLGRLREKDEGTSLYRAQRTFFNRYLFRSISIFQH